MRNLNMEGGLFTNMAPELAKLCEILLDAKCFEPKYEFDRVSPRYEEGLGRLPMELLNDIIVRLGLPDLLRFKLASKSLSDHIIGRPGFADEHLRYSLESGSSSPFLVFRDIASCHTIQLDRLEEYDLTAKVHHCLARGITIVGSCNGLLCILSDKSKIILYNPSTRERFELPAAPIDMPVPQGVRRAHSHLKYGLGYNAASSDFNVLRIEVASAFSTMLYSLKSNAWKKVDSLPSYVHELVSDHGVLCNETLHWVAKVRDVADTDLGVLAFHVDKQAYDIMPLTIHDLIPGNISLGSLDGCLCISFYVGGLGVDTYQVRVMKEYGVIDSWTPLFEFSGNLKSIAHMKPIAYSKNGDKVLVDINNTHFLWFDLNRKKVDRYVPCTHSESVICLGSVFSPKAKSVILDS